MQELGSGWVFSGERRVEEGRNGSFKRRAWKTNQSETENVVTLLAVKLSICIELHWTKLDPITPNFTKVIYYWIVLWVKDLHPKNIIFFLGVFNAANVLETQQKSQYSQIDTFIV